MSQPAPNVLPLTRTLSADTLTPVGILVAARKQGIKGFLLESVEGGSHLARYSILGFEPRERLFSREGKLFRRTSTGDECLPGSLPEALKARLAAFRPQEVPELPRFAGGYVGYLGYACAASVERLPVKPDPFGLPDAVLERFDDIIIYDHVRSRVTLLANAVLEDHASEPEARAEAQSRLERLAALIASAGASPLDCGDVKPELPNLPGREAYATAVTKAKEHIRLGDIFQVVLSTQFLTPYEGDPLDIYRRMRMSNPSPYHFFLDQEEATILGGSPEMLVRVEDRQMEVRPIAGTRPRGATPEADEALRSELLEDPKEAAEHVMLVDLGRNDVGRVCEFGSVKVAAFRTVEAYSHVFHIVSSVVGHLRPDAHPVDALFAGFPAGTVSGAPKIRAMEIIHDLEGPGRGVYSGAVGYFDYRGNLDTCIAIRTAIVKDGMVQLQAGAGIVADSIPDREFDECRQKIASTATSLVH
ncbi:anthranilate synthase component I family protein [Holophaga foetida]|uniref:anthranilate synthase component I family protein n=1 Tax=Holophaga foetida TaxID=35839 RepID=UPI0002474626|nr:chorismate-binding protein [Holophaga foetida]